MDCGERHYRTLMQNYPRVVRAFLGLGKQYQKVHSCGATAGLQPINLDFP